MVDSNRQLKLFLFRKFYCIMVKNLIDTPMIVATRSTYLKQNIKEIRTNTHNK